MESCESMRQEFPTRNGGVQIPNLPGSGLPVSFPVPGYSLMMLGTLSFIVRYLHALMPTGQMPLFISSVDLQHLSVIFEELCLSM